MWKILSFNREQMSNGEHSELLKLDKAEFFLKLNSLRRKRSRTRLVHYKKLERIFKRFILEIFCANQTARQIMKPWVLRMNDSHNFVWGRLSCPRRKKFSTNSKKEVRKIRPKLMMLRAI